MLDPAADPAGRHVLAAAGGRARHDDLRGRRPLRQRGGRHAQRLVGGRGRRHRRLAGQPVAELQRLGAIIPT